MRQERKSQGHPGTSTDVTDGPSFLASVGHQTDTSSTVDTSTLMSEVVYIQKHRKSLQSQMYVLGFRVCDCVVDL